MTSLSIFVYTLIKKNVDEFILEGGICTGTFNHVDSMDGEEITSPEIISIHMSGVIGNNYLRIDNIGDFVRLIENNSWTINISDGSKSSGQSNLKENRINMDKVGTEFIEAIREIRNVLKSLSKKDSPSGCVILNENEVAEKCERRPQHLLGRCNLSQRPIDGSRRRKFPKRKEWFAIFGEFSIPVSVIKEDDFDFIDYTDKDRQSICDYCRTKNSGDFYKLFGNKIVCEYCRSKIRLKCAKIGGRDDLRDEIMAGII